MGKSSTDFIRHTCPEADAKHHSCRMAVGHIFSKLEGDEAARAEKEVDEVLQELHDKNHELRDRLRDALECACAEIEDMRGERDDADERASKLQEEVDYERDRADCAEREADELRRELERVKRAAAAESQRQSFHRITHAAW